MSRPSDNLPTRVMIAALLAVGLAVVVSACGSSSSSTSTSGSSSAAGSSGSSGSTEVVAGPGKPTEPKPIAASEKEELAGKTVYLVSCSDQNQWCRAGNHKIIDELSGRGAQVTYLQDPYEPVLQVRHLEEAIAAKPDLVVLLASDAKAVIPALHKAKEEGVPVINISGPTVPESEEFYVSSLTENAAELGENAASLLVKGLQEEGVKSGNVFAVTGTQAAPEVPARMEGFHKVMEEHPEYKVVAEEDGEWDQVKTAEIAQQLFAKYKNQGGVVGAYGMADQMAAGIIQSAEQAGLPVGVENNGLIVVGSNCFKIGMENIEKGKEYGTSTQAVYVEVGFYIPYLIEFLEGKEIPKVGEDKEFPISKENLSEWKAVCSVA